MSEVDGTNTKGEAETDTPVEDPPQEEAEDRTLPVAPTLLQSPTTDPPPWPTYQA